MFKSNTSKLVGLGLLFTGVVFGYKKFMANRANGGNNQNPDSNKNDNQGSKLISDNKSEQKINWEKELNILDKKGPKIKYAYRGKTYILNPGQQTRFETEKAVIRPILNKNKLAVGLQVIDLTTKQIVAAIR